MRDSEADLRGEPFVAMMKAADLWNGDNLAAKSARHSPRRKSQY